MLGFVACQVVSKNAGIRMCERNWGDVKEINSGKRSHLSGESPEKRALICTTAWVKKARLRTNAKEDEREDNVDSQDQDLAFNKPSRRLESW